MDLTAFLCGETPRGCLNEKSMTKVAGLETEKYSLGDMVVDLQVGNICGDQGCSWLVGR